MDPDVVLEQARNFVKQARAAGTEGEKVRFMAEAIRCYEHLDIWKTAGGFNPKQWA